MQDAPMRALVDKYNSLAWQSGAEILRTDKLGHIAMGHDQELRYRYSGKLTA